MREEYLKHITVVVVGVGVTICAAIRPDTIMEAYMIYAFILGYVFKNGYHAISK